MTRRSLPAVACALLATALLATAPIAALARAGHAAAPTPQPPCVKTKHHTVDTSGNKPAVLFGISGGNIRPWSVTLTPDGALASSGGVTLPSAHLGDSRNSLAGILALADAEGFWTMKTSLQCPPAPDVAGRYIHIHAANGTRTVQTTGACNAHFNQLYAILTGITGVTR